MIKLPQALATCLLFGWAAGACARPQAPQGGLIPELPLRVVEAQPGHLSVVEPFSGPVEIRFERTVSERLTRGLPNDAVVVSPRGGEVEVQTSGDRIEISMEGGFEAVTVYRVTLLPRFQDRFQNVMGAPFDLFFSTGPMFEPNLLAGLASDRLTLEAVSEARVDAISADEGSVLSAVADTTGIFTFPYLPSGAYTVVAYEDNNRDREPGFTEVQGSASVSLTPGDTLIVTDLELLAPDTTAAILTDVAMLDSTALRASFDDYLDPNELLAGVTATVSTEDGDPLEVAEIIHLAEWESREPESVEPDPDSVEVVDEPDPNALLAPELILPVQDLVLVLSDPPIQDVTYEVEVQGVRNINGLPDGGGAEEFVGEPPPPAPEEVPEPVDPDVPDGAAAPPDSTAAPGDL